MCFLYSGIIKNGIILKEIYRLAIKQILVEGGRTIDSGPPKRRKVNTNEYIRDRSIRRRLDPYDWLQL